MIKNEKTRIVITMAGMGQRFRDAGFKIPKYQIKAHGHTLFYWSLLSLRNFFFEQSYFLFIVRAEDQAAEFIHRQCDLLKIKNRKILEIDTLTDGQATTAMYAEPYWDLDAPLMIYNIDTFVSPEALSLPENIYDGWIACFLAKGDHWSFVKVDGDGFASEVKEKVRISPFATIGLYWFKTARMYKENYSEYYLETDIQKEKERYVAPIYNQMIQNQNKVIISQIPAEKIYPLGTPQELDIFLKNPEPKL